MKRLLVVLCFTGWVGLAWMVPMPTPPPPITMTPRPTMIVKPTKTPTPREFVYYLPWVEVSDVP